MISQERRRYDRLSIRLALSCCKVSEAGGKSHRAYTTNISPGGMYFETPASAFRPGDLLRVELFVPPTTGVLESGGRLSGFVSVLRTLNIGDAQGWIKSSSRGYGVAVQFCQRPELCM